MKLDNSANELRIDNYVQFDTLTVYKVDIIYKDYVMLRRWEGVPLTEQWLIKFGFVKTDYNCFEFGDFILNDDFIMMDIDITIQLKYVHELQNLYYSLFKKELVLSESN